MAAVLLAAGAPAKRFALPHSRIMIHQGSGGFRGNTPDVMIQVKEMETLVNTNHEILSHHLWTTHREDRCRYLKGLLHVPTEAKEYGIIDAVYSATGNPLAALSQPADGADGVDKADGGQQPPEAELDRG